MRDRAAIRYPIGFSGDTMDEHGSRSIFSRTLPQTASNIGYGWWSHDIGGHMFGYQVMTSLLRKVGTASAYFRRLCGCTVQATNLQSKEPWSYTPRTSETAMIEVHSLAPCDDTVPVHDELPSTARTAFRLYDRFIMQITRDDAIGV